MGNDKQPLSEQPTPAVEPVVTGKHRMTPSEALVETLAAQGVTNVFGIVGSAYMLSLIHI